MLNGVTPPTRDLQDIRPTVLPDGSHDWGLPGGQDPNFPKLPALPLAGFDKLLSVQFEGGKYGHGAIRATKAVDGFAWAFRCHFPEDPILPGMLIIDSMLQLAGLWGGLAGFRGKGRAIKIGLTRFLAEVLPSSDTLIFEVEIRRVHALSQVVVANGRALVDGAICTTANDLCVQIRR